MLVHVESFQSNPGLIPIILQFPYTVEVASAGGAPTNFKIPPFVMLVFLFLA